MSASPGDPSGPLAILPSYQATSEHTEDSVWRLLARLCADAAGQPGDVLRGSGSKGGTRDAPPAAPRRDAGGLEPAAIAAFLNHALMPNESLFEGVRRVAPPLPRVHRSHHRQDGTELPTREGQALIATNREARLQEEGQARVATNREDYRHEDGQARIAAHREAHRQEDGQARIAAHREARLQEEGQARVATNREAHRQEDGQAHPTLPGAYSHDDDEFARTLLSACSDAVAVRLREGARDVSLSGGVDSAVLCMLAARLAPGRIRAWSMDVHFADETERRNARTVARLAGVEHVDVPIPDAVLPELFEPAVLANESPILNARAIASFAFYAEARRHGASVMLSGAGADEVLMGNPGALAAALARIEEDRRLVQTVLRPSVDSLRLGNSHDAAGAEGDRRLARAPVDNLRANHPASIAEALAVDNLGRAPAPWSLSDTSASEEVRYAAWVLRELVLPPELRGARAHGITVHTPYLDTRCADVALALPESSLRREGVGKWLFRHAVRGLVPEEVRLARKTPRYGHTALSSPVRARWLELYREWLSPARMEALGVILPEAPLALLERYTRLQPDTPEASVVDRLLMRLCSLAMLHAHAVRLRSCPES
ncbi:asparagine synthase-related protein [Myxococcus fulvus]|uniref:asparagine synthase-related protein n=1 Tax=Myxococcus fulvus TaxID=33 RepID=UPI003B99CF46